MSRTPARVSPPVNTYLPYVSLQPDYVQVHTDVAQGLQRADRAWMSIYCLNVPHASIHAKLTLTAATEKGKVDVQLDEDSARLVVLDRVAESVPDLCVRTQKVPTPAIAPQRSKIALSSTLLRVPKRTLGCIVNGSLGVTAFDISRTNNNLYVAAGVDGQAHVSSLPGGEGDERATDIEDGTSEGLDDSIEARAQRRMQQRMREKRNSQRTYLKGHVGDVRSARFFPSGEVVLTTSSDCTARVFGIDGNCPRTLTGHRRAVLDSAFIEKGKQVLTASSDGTTRLWDVGKGVQITSLASQSYSGVNAIASVDRSASTSGATDAANGSNASGLVVTGLSNGTLEVFDLASRKVVTRVPRSYFPSGDAPLASDSWQQIWTGGIGAIDWSAERNTIIVGADNGVTMLHDIRMLSSSAGTLAAAAEANAGGRDTPSSLLVRWRRNGAAVNDVQFDGQGRQALVATSDGTPFRIDLYPDDAGDGAVPRVVEEFTGWEIDNVQACRLDARSHVWLAGAEGKVRMY